MKYLSIASWKVSNIRSTAKCCLFLTSSLSSNKRATKSAENFRAWQNSPELWLSPFYPLFTNLHIPHTRKSIRIISCIYKIRGKHRRIHNTVHNNPRDKQAIGKTCRDIQVFKTLPHIRLEPFCAVDAVFFKQEVENKYISSRDITQGSLLWNKSCGKDMCENMILET